jgi:hypothetical protein
MYHSAEIYGHAIGELHMRWNVELCFGWADRQIDVRRHADRIFCGVTNKL